MLCRLLISFLRPSLFFPCAFRSVMCRFLLTYFPEALHVPFFVRCHGTSPFLPAPIFKLAATITPKIAIQMDSPTAFPARAVTAAAIYASREMTQKSDHCEETKQRDAMLACFSFSSPPPPPLN